MPRFDGRAADELRRVEFQPNFTTNPAGSVLVRAGRTMVLCTCMVEDKTPRWLDEGQGWVTAEYAMAPGSTHDRARRERRGAGGRTYEIQRLIGRSLRAGVDMSKTGERSFNLDCEVLQADGGTRTASITGAWVALALAVDSLMQAGHIEASPFIETVGAISCGVVDGDCVLDLPYEEDSTADVDMNLVLLGTEKIIEVQATGEGGTMSDDQLTQLIALGRKGISELRALQLNALGPAACARLGL